MIHLHFENSLCKIPAARSLSNYQKGPETQSHRLLYRKSTEGPAGPPETRNYLLQGPASRETWLFLPLWTQAPSSSCLTFSLWAHESETIRKTLLWIFPSVTLHDPFSKFYIFLFSFFTSFVLKFWKIKSTHFPYGALPGGQPSPQLPKACVMHMHGQEGCPDTRCAITACLPNVSMLASPAPHPVCPQISTTRLGLWISDIR